jgi:hypothetical protein
MSVFSPSIGNPSSAYPPTTGVAGSKQNMRVWIVSAIALSGTRATSKYGILRCLPIGFGLNKARARPRR